MSAQGSLIERRCTGRLDLKESLQPPHLENSFADEYGDLKEAPPLDTSIGALGCVTVGTFAKNNVALLILDLGYEFAHLANYSRISVGSAGRDFDVKDYVPSFSNGSCGASLSGT